MIPAPVIALGVVFYDCQRGHGAVERYARDQAVSYMRRKAEDAGDAMPFYEALADALATRAAAKLKRLRHKSAGADPRIFACNHAAHDAGTAADCPMCAHLVKP
jgi:hypothetical protein